MVICTHASLSRYLSKVSKEVSKKSKYATGKFSTIDLQKIDAVLVFFGAIVRNLCMADLLGSQNVLKSDGGDASSPRANDSAFSLGNSTSQQLDNLTSRQLDI